MSNSAEFIVIFIVFNKHRERKILLKFTSFSVCKLACDLLRRGGELYPYKDNFNFRKTYGATILPVIKLSAKR